MGSPIITTITRRKSASLRRSYISARTRARRVFAMFPFPVAVAARRQPSPLAPQLIPSDTTSPHGLE